VLLLGISSCLHVSQADSGLWMCLADQAPTTACAFKPRGEYLRVHAIGIQQSTTGDPWIHLLAVNQEVGWWLRREVKIEIKLLKDLTY
jgi:hypothetical protein